jgi:hypothetical protein
MPKKNGQQTKKEADAAQMKYETANPYVLEVLLGNGRTYVTTGADPDDSWSRDSTETDYAGVASVRSVPRNGKENSWRSGRFELPGHKPGDVVFIIVVQYGTGDTFGSDGGQTEIIDVFSDAREARAVIDWLEGKGNTGPISEFSAKCPVNGKEYEIPWTGYFEWLQGIHLEAEIITA